MKNIGAIKEKLAVLESEGFTRPEAIELLKVDSLMEISNQIMDVVDSVDCVTEMINWTQEPLRDIAEIKNCVTYVPPLFEGREGRYFLRITGGVTTN